jgi:hypothetical protein
MKTLVYLIGSASLVLMTACGSARAMPVDLKSDNAPLLSTPVPADATSEPIAPPAADQPSPVAQNMVDLSREDLSRILMISIDQIAIAKVEPVTWPDASLGCPKMGVMYIQTTTPGYIIQLKANDKTYRYNTDTIDRVILCNDTTLPEFPITPGGILDGKPWMPAD